MNPLNKQTILLIAFACVLVLVPVALADNQNGAGNQNADDNAPNNQLEINTAITDAWQDFLENRNTLRIQIQDKNQLRSLLVQKAKQVINLRHDQIKAKINALSLDQNDSLYLLLIQAVRDANVSDLNGLIHNSAKIKLYWKQFANKAAIGKAQRVNQSFLTTIANANRTVTKLETAVSKLKENGKDTSKIESGLVIVQTDINKLEVLHSQLRQEFADANTAKDRARIAYKAKKLLVVSRHRLAQDFKIIKKLVALARRMDVNASGSVIISAQSDVDSAVAELAAEESLEVQLEQIESDAEVEAENETELEDTSGGV